MIETTRAVFLSYASQDAKAARRICDALRAAGIEVWFDQNELRGGDAWDRQIRKQIHDCALFVPIISETTQGRIEGYFRREWKLAIERTHDRSERVAFLVPVVIDDTGDAEADVPEAFRAVQWTRLPAGEAPVTFVGHVARLLTDGTSRAPPVTPLPLTPPVPVARPDSSLKSPSIAVLPFANMSGDPEQEYFSDGITEDIITDLAKVSSLWVTARNTAFTYKGKHVDMPLVARQLNVSHLLEGSVRKAGGRVRITAQLIDGATGGHVWGERYDRDISDIFALQDEISQAIVAALKLKLLPEEKRAIEQRGTTNPEAYKLYLLARDYKVSGNAGSAHRNEAIIRLCRRATEIDPNYARPWALMAGAQAELRNYLGREGDGGLVAAERALSLDPNLAEAHAAKARVMLAEGRHDEARREIEIALRLDPESYEVNSAAGRWNLGMRQFGEAIQFYEKAAGAMETDFHAAGMLIGCYNALGDAAGARRAAQRALARTEKIVALEPDNGSAVSFLVSALLTLGQTERAKEWIERATLLDPDNLNMRYNFACTFINDLHDFEAALELLGPLLEKFRMDGVRWMRTDPDMDPIRDHPRFKAMVAAAEARLAESS
jgi:adenylate cyclase